MPLPPQEFLDQLRDTPRLTHYSSRTEQAYIEELSQFVLFHDTPHPKDLGRAEIETSLTRLAANRRVAAWNSQGLKPTALVRRDQPVEGWTTISNYVGGRRVRRAKSALPSG